MTKPSYIRLTLQDAEELKAVTEVVNATMDCLTEDEQATTHLARLQKVLNRACRRHGVRPEDLLRSRDLDAKAEAEEREYKAEEP